MSLYSRPSVDQWALEIALVTATRSTCVRRAVGCVFLDARNQVLATGYNGVHRKAPHCNDIHTSNNGDSVEYFYPHTCHKTNNVESGKDLEVCKAIHAEQNALMQCDTSLIKTAYITCSPCITCVKLFLNTSCSRIVFLESYPHKEARGMWEQAGRKWEKYNMLHEAAKEVK